MALPGEDSCRLVAPCGSGTWGDIPTDSTTEHVDRSYGGGSNDGSATHPWTTIQDGIDAAASGAIVAVAAGTYVENLVVSGKPVRLWGKCPGEVALLGSDYDIALSISAGSDGTEVRSIAVTGESTGVVSHGAENLLLDQLWIHDLTWIGVYSSDDGAPASLTLGGSLVERVRAHGLYGSGARVEVVDTVIRAVHSDYEDEGGEGITIVDSGALVVTRCLIEESHNFGIEAIASPATIEDTLVRNVAPRSSDGGNGGGIRLSAGAPPLEPAWGEVRGSVIEGCHEEGLTAKGTDLHVERTVVRDLQPSPAVPVGFGIVAAVDEDFPEHVPELTIRSSLLERIHIIGLAALGVDLQAEGVAIRDVSPASEPLGEQLAGFGFGLVLEPHPSVGTLASGTIRGLLVEGAVGAGVSLMGSTAEISFAAVRDITADRYLLTNGNGIIAGPAYGMRGDIHIADSLVERATETGIGAAGVHAVIDSCIVCDTRPRPLDEDYGIGILLTLDPTTDFRADGLVTRSLVEGNPVAGVAVYGSSAAIEHTVIRDCFGGPTEKRFGDGVMVAVAKDWAQLDLRHSLLSHNARAGLASLGAHTSIEGTRLDCNVLDINGEPFEGWPSDLQDTGGNTCGCGAESWPCAVSSAGLEAPEPPDPLGPAG